MKCLVFILLVSLSAVIVNARRKELEFVEMVNAIEQECLIKESVRSMGGMSMEEEYELEMKIKEWHCFLECVATDMGIIRDGTFYEKGFMHLISKVFDSDTIETEELHKVVEAIGDKCRISKNLDRCEAGFEFILCMQKVVDDHEELFMNLVDYDILSS